MAEEVIEIAGKSEVFIVAADPTESLMDIKNMLPDTDLTRRPPTPSPGLH